MLQLYQRLTCRVSLLAIAALWWLASETASGTQPLPDSPAAAPQSLTDADADRVKELESQIIRLRNDLKYGEAVLPARQVLDVWTRAQGNDHWETISARARLATVERIAKLSPAEQKEVNESYDQIDKAHEQFRAERFDECLKLLEEALGSRERLLGEDSLEAVGCRNNLAMVLSSLGKYADARTHYERAAEGIRSVLGENHPQLATAYSNLALNLEELNELQEALDYQEQALAIDLRTIGPEAASTANVRNNLGTVLDKLARHREAREQYQLARPIVLRESGEESVEAIRLSSNVAANAQYLGELEDAEAEFRRALAASRKVFPVGHSDIATIEMNLAAVLDDRGKLEEAETLLREALSSLQTSLSLNHPVTAGCLNNLAANLSQQGRPAEAEPLYRASLEIHRAGLPEGHPSLARLANNLANVLSDQGRDVEAELLFRKALEQWTEALGDHPDVANAANNLGMVLIDLGRLDEAETELRRALEVRRKLLGASHPLTAQSLNHLGGLFETRRQFANAEELYREAHVIRTAFDAESVDTAESCNNLAASIDDLDRLDEAERLYREALRIREERLGLKHPLTGQSYKNLGDFLIRRGQLDQAEKTLTVAAENFEASRRRIGDAGMERVKYSSERSPLVALAALLAEQGRPLEAWQRLEQHLGRGLLDELALREDRRLAPEERATLRRLVGEVQRFDRFFDIPPEKRPRHITDQQHESLGLERERAQRSLADFRQSLRETYGTTSATVVSYEELQSLLPADVALLTWVDHGLPAAGEGDAGGRHWGVVVRASGSPEWVRLDGTGPEGHWDENDVRLTSRVRRGLHGMPSSSKELASLLKLLRVQRLDPLTRALGSRDDALPAARRLIVLPSAAMTGIPVESLLETDDARVVSYVPSATVLAFLSRQPPVDPRGGLLAVGDPLFAEPKESELQTGQLPGHGLAVAVVLPGSNAKRGGIRVGDVFLSYDGKELKSRADLRPVAKSASSVTVRIWRRGQTLLREVESGPLGIVLDRRPANEAVAAMRREAAASRLEYPPLPGTRDEILALSELCEADGRPIELLAGVDASEARLRTMSADGGLKRFALIHLATHGELDGSAPWRSAVILSQVNLPDPFLQVLEGRPVLDGRISVGEIEREWELHASLVTVSACETARGKYASGEGFVGFTQALIGSGARSVCLPLWKVDDVATALLMQRFYANLLGRRKGATGPMPKAEALAEARNWLRTLSQEEALERTAGLRAGVARSKNPAVRRLTGAAATDASLPAGARPFEHPRYWAAFVLIGEPE